MNYIIWQSEPDAQKDVAQLVYNDVVKGYAIITTDCGRPQVIRISEQDLGKLMSYALKFNMELRKKAAEEKEEEYEKSEKDCMWERD